MAENPKPFTSNTLNQIKIDARTLNAIALKTGISVLSIAAPFAREMNKHEIDYPQRALGLKILYPILFDIGPGKVQIKTAIDLLKSYLSTKSLRTIRPICESMNDVGTPSSATCRIQPTGSLTT